MQLFAPGIKPNKRLIGPVSKVMGMAVRIVGITVRVTVPVELLWVEEYFGLVVYREGG